MVDKGWIDMLPQATIRHLHMEASEHCQLLIQTDQFENKVNRPFRLLKVWNTDNTCALMVNSAWHLDCNSGLEWHKLNQSLRHTSKAMRKWNMKVFIYSHVKIIKLEQELENLQRNNENRRRQLT